MEKILRIIQSTVPANLKRSFRKAQELDLFKEKISQSYQPAWVVYCEPALAKAEHVVKYLG